MTSVLFPKEFTNHTPMIEVAMMTLEKQVINVIAMDKMMRKSRNMTVLMTELCEHKRVNATDRTKTRTNAGPTGKRNKDNLVIVLLAMQSLFYVYYYK